MTAIFKRMHCITINVFYNIPCPAKMSAEARAKMHESAALGFAAHTLSPYEAGRPEWADDRVHFLLRKMKIVCQTCDSMCNCEFVVDQTAPVAPLLEIGAGTGKSTRSLLRVLQKSLPEHSRPKIIVCEPAEMGKLLTSQLGLEVFEARAEDMSCFPSDHFGGVLLFQAFHWCANSTAVNEISRVLKPGAFLGLAWNTRRRDDDDVWMCKVEALIERYHDGRTPQQQTGKWKEAFDHVSVFGPLHSHQFKSDGKEFKEVRTADELVAWILSISVVAKQSEDERANVAAEVKQLVEDGLREAVAHHHSATAKGTGADGSESAGADQKLFQHVFHRDTYYGSEGGKASTLPSSTASANSLHVDVADAIVEVSMQTDVFWTENVKSIGAASKL
jgi:SAM-dependent methyltransferase